jgi:MFS family permease
MTAMTFAIGAVAAWMPAYLEDHQVEPLLGLKAGEFFGGLTALAGLTATLAGGMAGDALRGRFPGSYFLVSGVGLLLSVPCCLLFLAVPFPRAWVFVFLAEFFLFFNTGPTNAILANVTHPSMRATAFGLNILVIHLLGDAVSPPLVGTIADRFGGDLAPGFVVVSAFMALGGLIWLWGTRYLEADTAAAPHRLDALGPAA